MTVSYVEENLLQISWPAIYRQADPLSPFLIGRMFLREPSWKYSAKLVGS